MKTLSLRELTAEMDKLRDKRIAEIRNRIDSLMELRDRIDTELLVLADEVENAEIPGTLRRRSRHVIPECGTESAYQRHRHLGEKCDECKRAHAGHERVMAARRKLAKIAGAA